jgi:hypothetical protein
MALMIMHGVLEQCIMQRMEKPENGWLRQIPNVVGIGGGAPIKVGNETIGGSASPAHPPARTTRLARMPALQGWRTL